MKTHPDKSNWLPTGYELMNVDEQSFLALPAAAARERREELKRREAELEMAEREAALGRRLEEIAQARAVELRKSNQENALNKGPKNVGGEPMPGWYRIIPKWEEFVESASDPAAALRSAEKEVNDRQAKLRKLLLEKGPDRWIAKPPDWRQALDRLEASLPHFRGPIRQLRHSLALADATGRPVRVPPMLLLGPPGVGKTYFSHRVAEIMRAPHASIAFDSPSAGAELKGSPSYYGNSATGLLFELLCVRGDAVANPVILLDEIDKSCTGTNRGEIEPLAQLHGALEPETSRQTVDSSVEIEFDASQVTYIATANTARGIGLPILSRTEVHVIDAPDPSESVDIARAIVDQLLERLKLRDTMRFDRKGLYVLAHMSPRLMLRTAENAIAAAVTAGREEVLESDVWAEARFWDYGPRLH